MSEINFDQGNSGDSAFGSQGRALQVLFDESIADGAVIHETWSHAWGRAVSYAWQSEENKQELLNDPHSVLAKFNYEPPAGVEVYVVDANSSEDQSINLKFSGNEVKYHPENLARGHYKAYLVNPETIQETDQQSSAGGNQVAFSLAQKGSSYLNRILKSEISPVNGWVELPEQGVIAKHPSGRLWWVTTENFEVENWPEGETFYAPMVDQFVSNEKVNPTFFKLASTIVMKLPPKPEGAHAPMALMDYDALGKIYPFTT